MSVFASPVVLLVLVFGSLWAILFLVFLGKRVSELLLYWPASVVGFAVGHLVGAHVGLMVLVLGDVHLLEGSAAAVTAILLARWLRL